MSNPTVPTDEPLATDSLTSGEYSYGESIPVTGDFSLTEPEPAIAPATDESVEPDSVSEVPEEVTDSMPEETMAPEAMENVASDEAFSPIAPQIPADFTTSPWADLSFLTTPGPMHPPSPELAEATQPQPASGVSPSAGSSPDVHPTEMPQTPVSPGVAETAGSEVQDDINVASPVNVEAPSPSAVESPPAPVASPPLPMVGEPNMAAGELPSGAGVPDGAAGTAPIHPEPQAPAAVDMQMQMSENMVDHMANVLKDILQGKAP